MSRAEEITSEVRRLVLTCRAMEAQLQQSIAKKTHQEVVAKMQATIDGLNAEFERVKADLQKTVSLNETIAGIGSNITSQNETITSLGVTVKNQNQIIEEQNKAIEALNSRLSQSTVPVLLYDQTLSKVEEMQEKIRCMVDKVDYVSIQKKCDELSESIKSMVPREDYLNLQNQFANFVPRESFEALQRTLSQYVPRDQLVASETRVHELEARLENYVPRSDYEELTARIALLAKEASALSIDVPQAVLETKIAPMEQVSPAEATPSVETIPIAEPIAVVVEQPQIHEEVSQIIPNPVATELPIAESVAMVETPIPANATAQEIVAKVTEEVTPEVQTIQEIITVGTVPEAPRAETVAETPIVEPVAITSPAEAIVEIPSIPVVEARVEQIVEQAPQETKPEITEIQAQLSEIKGVEDSGITTIQAKTVDSTQGFVFANTTFCARSGLEFLQDLEQTPIETIQNHMIGGDFERWFKEALTDDSSAESLRSIRESNFTGEELRAKIVAVIAPRYKS
ncbi:MAG: hypothetical protein ACYCPW_09815 [Nitrososphaerales archaeon]